MRTKMLAVDYASVAHLERECFLQDSVVINTLLELCLVNDDEEIFNLLLHKILWCGYYKQLFSLSLENNTTKYLERLINMSGSMLMDELSDLWSGTVTMGRKTGAQDENYSRARRYLVSLHRFIALDTYVEVVSIK